jgi:uncharacterized protein
MVDFIALEVVVIGTGRDYQPLPANVLKFFSNLGVQVEAMPSVHTFITCYSISPCN